MIKLLTEREVLLSLSDISDEPRDDHGRWTTGNESEAGVKGRNLLTMRYRNALHDEIGSLDGKLLHGTAADVTDTLVPDVGEFVKSAYGINYDSDDQFETDIKPLVFMSPLSGTGLHKSDVPGDSAFTAMQAQVAKKIGKGFHDVTGSDVEKHGRMAVVIDDSNFTRITEHGRDYGQYPEGYSAAEPGDVVSEDNVAIDRVIKGVALRRLWTAYARTWKYDDDSIKASSAGDVEPRLLTEREVLAAFSEGGNPNHDARGRFASGNTVVHSLFSGHDVTIHHNPTRAALRTMLLRESRRTVEYHNSPDLQRFVIDGDGVHVCSAMTGIHSDMLNDGRQYIAKGHIALVGGNVIATLVKERHLDLAAAKKYMTSLVDVVNVEKTNRQVINTELSDQIVASDGNPNHDPATGRFSVKTVGYSGPAHYVDVYKNPTRSDLLRLTKPDDPAHAIVRTLSDGKDVYAFGGNTVHGDIEPAIGKKVVYGYYNRRGTADHFDYLSTYDHSSPKHNAPRRLIGQTKRLKGFALSSGNPNHDEHGRFATGHSIMPHIASPEAADALLGRSPAIVHVIPTTTQTATPTPTKLEHIEHRFYTALDGPPGLSATDRAAHQASFQHPEENRKAISEALAHMTPAMLARVDQNLGHVKWFPDLHTLQTEAGRYEPGVILEDVKVEGFCRTNAGKIDIHLDGPGYNPADYGGVNKQKTAREIYAHELGHVIDGPELTYSSSDEWIDAANIDIIQHQMLTNYATTSAQEAFAETVRAINTKGVAACRARLPHCMKVIKDWGLV